MKNIKYVIALIFIIILVFIFKDTILDYLRIIFEKLIYYEKNYFYFFLICLLLINLINFLTPIPTFPIIIFNGFVLKDYGFFLSYILIILCSFILFNSVKKLYFFLNTKFYLSTVSIINNYKNNDFNFFLLSISRYVLPYFIHNVFFGSILKKNKIFLSSVLIAEIPIVFILNKFGKDLRSIDNFSSIDINSILKTEYLLTFSLLFLLLLIVNRATNYIKNRK
tara:strand:- start:19 stop:687 length:669 start_codon:yes stop_codon:yes gene_type:complete